MRKRIILFLAVLLSFACLFSFSVSAETSSESESESVPKQVYNIYKRNAQRLLRDVGEYFSDWYNFLFGSSEPSRSDVVDVLENEDSHSSGSNTEGFSVPQSWWVRKELVNGWSGDNPGRDSWQWLSTSVEYYPLSCRLVAGKKIHISVSCNSFESRGFDYVVIGLYYPDTHGRPNQQIIRPMTYTGGSAFNYEYEVYSNDFCQEPYVFTDKAYIRFGLVNESFGTRPDMVASFVVSGDGIIFDPSDEIQYTSTIQIVNPNYGPRRQLKITLQADRDVNKNHIATCGILYDDMSQAGFINSDYVHFTELGGRSYWEWIYNLDDFIQWAYRERLNFDYFYGQITVIERAAGSHIPVKTVHVNFQRLDLPYPGGVFQDVEDMPEWINYQPTYIIAPSYPTVTFEFTANNNYQSINTFNIDNSTTVTDYYNFIDNSLNVINNNLNLLTNNVNNFFTAVDNYVDGSVSAQVTYIGDCVTTLDENISLNFDAFASYIGDCFATLNYNVEIIIDNIKQIVENQAIPDSDYLDFIISDCLGWYQQIYDVFDSKNFESSSFSFYFEAFDYTFVFDDAELAGNIKTSCSVVLLALTALAAFRFGYQMFGIDIGGDDK